VSENYTLATAGRDGNFSNERILAKRNQFLLGHMREFITEQYWGYHMCGRDGCKDTRGTPALAAFGKTLSASNLNAEAFAAPLREQISLRTAESGSRVRIIADGSPIYGQKSREVFEGSL